MKSCKCHPKEASCQKKEKKLLRRFWDCPPPPLKVDDATAADDGRVWIWKAPLPGGTAELKNIIANTLKQICQNTPILIAQALVQNFTKKL